MRKAPTSPVRSEAGPACVTLETGAAAGQPPSEAPHEAKAQCRGGRDRTARNLDRPQPDDMVRASAPWPALRPHCLLVWRTDGYHAVRGTDDRRRAGGLGQLHDASAWRRHRRAPVTRSGSSPARYPAGLTLADGVSLAARVAGTVTFTRPDPPPSSAGEASPAGDWIAIDALGDSGGEITGIRIDSTPDHPIDVGHPRDRPGPGAGDAGADRPDARGHRADSRQRRVARGKPGRGDRPRGSSSVRVRCSSATGNAFLTRITTRGTADRRRRRRPPDARPQRLRRFRHGSRDWPERRANGNKFSAANVIVTAEPSPGR